MNTAPCPPASVALPRAGRRACGPARALAASRVSARRFVSSPAAAAAEDSKTQAFLPEFHDPATAQRWHFVIANADFMLNDENNEHFPEVLRERRRFFLENNAPVNFFLVTNPAWLDALPDVAKQVRQPAVALVCPDATWIAYVPSASALLQRARQSRRATQVRQFVSGRARCRGLDSGTVRIALPYLRALPQPTYCCNRCFHHRYCKLRLDRVLRGELQGSLADVTASKGAVAPFAKPASWTAPYLKYSQGWWDMFTHKG